MSRALILVPGTWRGAWAEDAPGTLYRELVIRGYDVHVFRGWSGNVDGVPSLFDAEEDGDANGDWRAGGWSFRYFLRGFREPPDVLVHSHGINPVLYQATLRPNGFPPQRIRTLISVCSPSRGDMQDRAFTAVRCQFIAHWTHVYAHGWDFFARAGELFDGHWGWRRKWPAAHVNIGMKGIGHSKLLNDLEYREELLATLAAAIDHAATLEARR